MVRNSNDTDLHCKEKSFHSDENGVELTTLELAPCNNSNAGNGSISNDNSLTTTTISQHNQLQLAMNIADTVRRYENEVLQKERNSKFAANSDDIKNAFDFYNNYAHPIISNARQFWETPGIQAGCMTACCCIIPIIPLRRTLLHYMNHSMNLGTALPDLLFTPAITMVVAQCSVYVGTCYGVLHYLNKVASTPITQTETTTWSSDVKSSPVNRTDIDSICHDPIFIDATNALKSSYSEKSSSPSFVRQYDVRDKVTTALYDAVQSCQKRRDLNSYQRP